MLDSDILTYLNQNQQHYIIVLAMIKKQITEKAIKNPA